MNTPYTCGYCGKQNDDIFPESCSLTGDILSVQMATIVQFQSQYSGDGLIFCDVECFGAWLEPRVHRLFENDAEEEGHRAREAAVGAALPANWSVR